MLHSTAERFRWTNLPSDPLQDWTASCTTQNTVPVRIITTFMRQCVWQQWDICTIRAFRQIHPMHEYTCSRCFPGLGVMAFQGQGDTPQQHSILAHDEPM